MLRLLKQILASIESQAPASQGFPVLPSGDYEPVPLDAGGFHPFDPCFPPYRVGFLDAGNNEIFSTPAVAVGWVRVYWGLFEGERKIRHRLRNYLVVVQKGASGSLIDGEVFPVEGGKPLHFRFPPPLPPGEPTRSPLAGAIGAVRRHLEWLDTLDLVRELHPGDLVVRDGTLEVEEEEGGLARAAWAYATRKGVRLIGLSKSCALLTTSGAPLLSALAVLEQEAGVRAPWVYYPLGYPKREDAPFIVVARLHAASPHLFRVDLPSQERERAEEMMSTLAAYAQDPLLPGYPYGLLDADKHARVPEKEVQLLRRVAEQEMGPLTSLGYWALSADRMLKGI